MRDPIDLDYRPESYFLPRAQDDALLAQVKRDVVRRELRAQLQARAIGRCHQPHLRRPCTRAAAVEPLGVELGGRLGRVHMTGVMRPQGASSKAKPRIIERSELIVIRSDPAPAHRRPRRQTPLAA